MFRRFRAFSLKNRLATRRPAAPRQRLRLCYLEERAVPATITVTNNTDLVAVDGTVSLREALNSVNGGADINADVIAVGAYGTNDTVLFDAGVVSPITLPSGQLDISKAVLITGPGSGLLTIQNTAATSATSRVFNNTNVAGTVSISGLTISGGDLTTGNNGAGIIMTAAGSMDLMNVVITGNKTAGTGEGGGISNQSTGVLTITSSTISLNMAGADGGGINNQSTGVVVLNSSTLSGNTAASDGGAIYMNNGGKLTLSGSIITGNTATGTSGGIYVFGSAGVWQITNSTITLNEAKGGVGGGIRVNSGALTVTNSSITSNKASTTGGGINQSGGTITLNTTFIGSNTATTNGGGINSSSTLTINSSTIDGNTANTQGGGLNTSGLVNVTAPVGTPGSTISNNSSPLGGGWNMTASTVTFRNSTLASNTATGTSGGGGFNLAGATLNIQNSTVALNKATGVGAVGGGFRRASGTLNISSALIASNTATTGGQDGHSTAAATITLNNSLIGSNSADNITYTGTGQINVAAGLDPAGLQLNGAPVGTPLTIGLMSGSLALETGNNLQGLTTDQRGAGFPRQQGPGADVGAFERASPIPSASGGPYAPVVAVQPDYTFTVTYTDNDTNIDVGSLDNNDIQVTGPGGPYGVTFITNTAAAKSVTATYKVAPGGGFTNALNGVMTINVVAGQVFDTDGTPNSVPAGAVGTFSVSIVSNYIVNATNDEAVDTDGKTSLREALALANADSTTFDTISFDGTVFGTAQTITLDTLNQLPITGSVTITGPGSGLLTVNSIAAASANSRVLNITGGTNISISGMTLSGGNVTGGGGGVNFTSQTITLSGMVVSGNAASTIGGGINFTTGSLTLTNSTVSSNAANGVGGGGVYFTTGKMTATGSTISTNSSPTAGSTNGHGGGIYVRSTGLLTLTDSSVNNNTAGNNGGGIYFFSGGSSNISGSSVSNNNSNTQYSSNGGGGIYVFGGSHSIVNSTISGNKTNSGGKDSLGGGISSNSSDTITIQNSTVAFNDAGTKSGGGINRRGTATITLVSTIVSNNTATTGADVNGAVTANFSLLSSSAGATITGADNLLDVSAQLNPLALNGGTTLNHLPQATSPVFNKGSNPLSLTLDQRGAARVQDGTADIGSVESVAPASSPPTGVATAPDIAAVQAKNTITVVYTDAETNIDVSKLDNNDLQVTGPGGPYGVTFIGSTPAAKSVTATYEIAPGGGFTDALNGNFSINIVAGEVFDTDVPPQSAMAGPIGSFKVAIATTYVVNATNDESVDTDGKISLREAIEASNANAGAVDSITFDPAVFSSAQTITLALGQLSITDAVTITGPTVAPTVDAVTMSRVLTTAGAPAGAVISISNLQLTNGKSTGTTAADVGGGLSIDDENVTLTGVTVANNSAVVEGGGIGISAAAGKLTLIGSSVTGNISTGTTGLHNGAGGGIGMRAASTVVINNSTIANNTGNRNGGGIYFYSGGALTVTGSTISGNKAVATTSVGGGGIYFYGTATTFTISNTTVSGNSADNGAGGGYGGGIVLNYFAGSLIIQNSTVAFNNAGKAGGGIASAGAVPTFDSSIFAKNTVSGSNAPTADVSFFAAVVVGGDNNLIGIQDPLTLATFGAQTQTGSLATPLDPLLGPLANNGGPTQTHALLAGSPAVNKGNNVAALATDQRGVGFPRVVGLAADVGAFEVTPPTLAPGGFQVNGGGIQRSMVTSIVIDFTVPVSFPSGIANAFKLDRTANPSSGPQSALPLGSVDITAVLSAPNQVTITFPSVNTVPIIAGSLPDGVYNLTIVALEITGGATGGFFDGNGDGNGGDDSIQNLHRLFGDADGNGTVTAADFNAFRLDYGTTGPSFFDYNGDNQVSASDFNEFRTRYGVMVP